MNIQSNLLLPITEETPNIEISQSNYLRLLFAQQKLLDPALPLKLKALSYIRIGCSTMRRHYQSSGSAALLIDSEAPYISLLAKLSNCNLTWWNLCSITDGGHLTSSDRIIYELLQPLNRFIAQHLEQSTAQNSSGAV